MSQKTHNFDDTEMAYDMCQCDVDVKKGDILICENEKVIGLADTWPSAITTEYGALHATIEGVSVRKLVQEFDLQPYFNKGDRVYTDEQIDAAIAEADRRGWQVDTKHRKG